MSEKMKLNIVGAQSYSFTDSSSGRLVEGLNVFHLVEGDPNKGTWGLIPSKITLPYEMWKKISLWSYPVNCEVITEQTFSKKGVVTKVVDLVPLAVVK